MKKKKGGGGGANWMDTYGDMVTLLLCFFVLLYSMSTIDEAKWKAIVQSFNPLATQVQTEVEGGGDGPSADDDLGGVMPSPEPADESQDDIDTMIEELYQAMMSMVASEGMQSTIQVEMDGGKVYVKFSDTVFFTGDSYTLQPRAKEILLKVCGILDEAKDAIEEIRVQGHTAQEYADKPNGIVGDRRLASNRATEVVIFLQENSSIHPARLTSEGMGQWRPISGNDTAENRARNRRVEMIISGRNLDMEALGEALSQFVTQDDAGEEV